MLMLSPQTNSKPAPRGQPPILNRALIDEVVFLVKIGTGLLLPSDVESNLRLSFEDGQIRFSLQVSNCKLFRRLEQQPLDSEKIYAECAHCTPEQWTEFELLVPMSITPTESAHTLNASCTLRIPEGSESFYQQAVLNEIVLEKERQKSPDAMEPLY